MFYETVAFSPDGDEIYFTRFDAEDRGSVWRIPTLGGTPVRVFEGYVRGPVLSRGERSTDVVLIENAAAR